MHNSPQFVFMLDETNQVHVILNYFFTIHFNIIVKSTIIVPPCAIFLSARPTNTLNIRLLSPIRATCLAHLSVLDSFTQIIIDEWLLKTLLRTKSKKRTISERCVRLGESGLNWLRIVSSVVV